MVAENSGDGAFYRGLHLSGVSGSHLDRLALQSLGGQLQRRQRAPRTIGRMTANFRNEESQAKDRIQ